MPMTIVRQLDALYKRYRDIAECRSITSDSEVIAAIDSQLDRIQEEIDFLEERYS
jgi:hypothetical protein